MAEMMLFPDTWEEFEKQYGFYDIKQAYMFGNARLIPSFRVQQWLDHIDDIKRKKQSQNNKMEQVAAMFDKELGKEFIVEDKYKAEWYCKFTKNGVMYQDRISFNWHMIGGMLQSLVTGKAVIKYGD